MQLTPDPIINNFQVGKLGRRYYLYTIIDNQAYQWELRNKRMVLSRVRLILHNSIAESVNALIKYGAIGLEGWNLLDCVKIHKSNQSPSNAINMYPFTVETSISLWMSMDGKSHKWYLNIDNIPLSISFPWLFQRANLQINTIVTAHLKSFGF